MDNDKSEKKNKPNLLKIIIIAISLILILVGWYAGYFSISPSIRDQCISTPGVECLGGIIDITNKEISLEFTNNIGKELIINSVNMTLSGIVVSTCEENQIIEKNSEKQINLTNPVQPEETFVFNNCTLNPKNTSLALKKTGDKAKIQFAFEYTAIGEGELPHLVMGTLTTTVGSAAEIKKIKTIDTIKDIITNPITILLLILMCFFLFRKITKNKENKQK